MCTFDQILTLLGLFLTEFSKIAQFLILRAHVDEISTLSWLFLAQILTLRAHVDEILTLRGFYCPVTPTNAGI